MFRTAALSPSKLFTDWHRCTNARNLSAAVPAVARLKNPPTAPTGGFFDAGTAPSAAAAPLPAAAPVVAAAANGDGAGERALPIATKLLLLLLLLMQEKFPTLPRTSSSSSEDVSATGGHKPPYFTACIAPCI